MTRGMRSAATARHLGASVAGLALGAAVACAAPACGTFSSADVVAPGDGGTDATSANGDGANGDGGPDAAGSDAGCTSSRACGCVAGAAFCADFEGTTPVEEWEVRTEENGGALSFVSSDRSAPHALQATTSPAAADGGSFGATAKALVSKTFVEGDVAKLSLAFDMAAPSLPCAKDSDGTYFVSLIPTGGAGALALLQTKSGPKMFVKGAADEYTALKTFTNTKTWTHVTMVASGGALTVSYDGVAAGGPIPFAVTSTGFTLVMGLTNEPAATDCTVSYDNVVLRFAP